MLYRFISQLTYTDFLRQELMISSWYFYTVEHDYMTIGSPHEITILFPWTNTENKIAKGLGFNMLDAYYTLTGNRNYMDFGIEAYGNILDILDWLRSGMLMGEY